jgi:hypothetical protein
VPKLILVGAVALLALSLFMFNAGAQFIVCVAAFCVCVRACVDVWRCGDVDAFVWVHFGCL